MRRREFITLLGSAAATWPVAARAQQPDRVRLIRTLLGNGQSEVTQSWLAAFLGALSKLGSGSNFAGARVMRPLSASKPGAIAQF